MPNLKEIQYKKIASQQYFIEALRGIMETAAAEELTYLEITYKTRDNNKPNGFTIGGASHLRDK